MAGVFQPMMNYSPSRALRFFAGWVSGGVVGASLLAGAITLLSRAHPAGVTGPPKVVAAVVLVGLGTLDLRKKTPQLDRQVPQTFIHRLRPGRLGFIWASDLNLLVSTKMTTSLIWASLAMYLARERTFFEAFVFASIVTVGSLLALFVAPQPNPRIPRIADRTRTISGWALVLLGALLIATSARFARFTNTPQPHKDLSMRSHAAASAMTE